LVCLFAAAFLALSMIRYSPGDPGFGTVGSGVAIRNLGGVVGAWVSDFLLQFIGLAALALPLLLVVAGVTILRSRKVAYLWVKLVGFAIMTVFLAAFFNLFWGQIEVFHASMDAGGLFGSFISRGLMGLFNRAGAGVIMIMALMLTTMVTTGGSVVVASRWLAVYARKIVRLGKQLRVIISERKLRRDKVAALREKEAASVQPLIAEKPLPAPPSDSDGLKIKEPKKPAQEKFEFIELAGAGYQLPSLSVLDDPPPSRIEVDRDTIMMNARILKKKLEDYGVEGDVVEVHPGPVITSYEFAPAAGVKVNKIVNLADDLSLALSAISVRIVAPIPGKAVVGIEIPNKTRQTVYLKEILGSESFANHPSKLALGLGKDIEGEAVVLDLKKMPHLLVAGATGSGKSVSLNAMITSILFKATPDDVRLLMVDMKRLELGVYESIPHLLHGVITTPKDAAAALKWAVREMEERYRLMAERSVRNVESYNKLVQKEIEAEKKGGKGKTAGALHEDDSDEEIAPEKPLRTLPLILIIIDELADLMMIAAREVEESIARLAQMARASGIHLILATQRPSVDVLTGLIKANFPARISFQVAQKVDSRTIIDANGAERLLGDGDMLFLGTGSYKLKRIHGAYVSEPELHRLTDFLKGTGTPQYDSSIVAAADEGAGEGFDEAYDERYDEAVAIVTQTRQASISMIQRRLRVGYNRAARMIERMEIEGIVGPSDGVKPREVLIDPIQVQK